MNPWALAALATATAGTLRWRRRRGQVARLRHSLRAAQSNAPVPEQLSAGLRWLVVHARTLRALLEGPLRSLVPPMWGESPWARRRRCEAWDLAVVDLRRAAWDWRMGFARLDGPERAWLETVGLARVPLAGLILGGVDRTSDPWEQVLFAREPDPSAAGAALQAAAQELQQFEELLSRSPGLSYRIPA